MEGFKKLTDTQKENIKGGFAWMALFEAGVLAVSLIKTLSSHSGSIKSKELGEIKWDNSGSISHPSSSAAIEHATIVYDFS